MTIADRRGLPVVVAGGGIAGLTAALSLAREGFRVVLHERMPQPHEVGAGLQLSPNATGILDRLGVLPSLLPLATTPDALLLRDAIRMREIARVPLGAEGGRRWNGPYIVLHRVDLHSRLLAAAAEQPLIEVRAGSSVKRAAVHAKGVTVTAEEDDKRNEVDGLALVLADGVWSRNRHLISGAATHAFTGRVAWRATIDADRPEARALIDTRNVNVFVHSRAHLVAYPVKSGTQINLAAFARGVATDESWAIRADGKLLIDAFTGVDSRLAALLRATGDWTVWPLHGVDPSGSWTDRNRIVAIGDAAHAMTPFAAQGAGMGIEDAYVLASHIAAQPDAVGIALQRFEAERKPRVTRVVRRGRFNEFTWHAAGPIALGRDMVLKLRRPSTLAADMDWLYGWTPEGA